MSKDQLCVICYQRVSKVGSLCDPCWSKRRAEEDRRRSRPAPQDWIEYQAKLKEWQDQDRARRMEKSKRRKGTGISKQLLAYFVWFLRDFAARNVRCRGTGIYGFPDESDGGNSIAIRRWEDSEEHEIEDYL